MTQPTIEFPDPMVLLVQGPGQADAARRAFPNFIVHDIDSITLDTLKGWDVTIWAPESVAAKVSSKLAGHGPTKVIQNPPDLITATYDQITGALNAAVTIIPPPAKPKPQRAPTVETQDATPALPASTIATLESCGVLLHNGKPTLDVDNASRVLEHATPFAGKFKFDTFHNRVFSNWNGPERPWTDNDTLQLQVFFQRECGFQKVSKDTIYDAVHHAALLNQRNEPKEWMESLEWDQVDRLSTFMMVHLGAAAAEHQPEDYLRAVGRNWWISMIARIYNPGCKVDTMLVLKGEQGKFKSTAFEIIGGKWYAPCTADADDSKAFGENLQGKMLMEMPELANFKRADIEAIKRLLSQRYDRFRASYGRISQDWPRQGILVGTTNKDAYLNDPTGARRFNPAEIECCDRHALVRDRAQLFAQAVACYRAWETSQGSGWKGRDDSMGWWELPASAQAAQENARVKDESEEQIMEWCNARPEGVSLRRVWIDCLGLRGIDYDQKSGWRLGSVLRARGWVRDKKVSRHHDEVSYLWHPINAPF